MKRFILNSILVIAGVVVIDICVGLVGRFIVINLNQKNYSGQAALFGYNLEGAQADIIVLGSSTASCHYDPQLLADSLSSFLGEPLTAYNAGAYYQQTPYPYCVLNSIIKRKVPKYVILDVQPQQLGESINEAAMKPMRPYYTINSYVKEVFDENESLTNRFLLLSNMYRYNTEILKIVASFRNSVGNNGFDPRDGMINEFVIAPSLDKNELNPVFVSEFERTIKVAKNNNISLYVIMSPRAEYTDKSSQSYKKIVELCNLHKVLFVDFTSDNDFNKSELFYDKHHLNRRGAQLLTEKTYELIKSDLLLRKKGQD